MLSSLMPDLSSYKPFVRLVIALIALGSIIVAVARPWGGVTNQETSKEGIEIVIAVDASNSMYASATGDEKGTSRMKTAKLMLEKLINRLGNDKVGLIAYAGDAYTLIPVTNDYVSAKAFLNSIDPSMIPHQGTNIGAAINMAERSFSDRGDVGKAIILLTDADELEDLEGTVNEVKQASKRGIQTDIIGIGSSPVTIPTGGNGRMIDGETGEIVKTALNENLALDIAKAGQGIYVNASNNDAVDELIKQLSTLKKAAMESSFLVSHDELYFPFAILAIVLLIIDFILTDKKNRWLGKINFFKKETAAMVALIMLTAISTACSRGNEDVADITDTEATSRRDSLLSVYSLPKERDFILRGNSELLSGNFEKADSNYTAALKENGRSVVANLNQGLSSIGSIEKAVQQNGEEQMTDSMVRPYLQNAQAYFAKAAAPKVKKNNVSSLAFYNMGNIAFGMQDFGSAIEMYKEALRLNPSDEHARRNLRIAQLQQKDNNDQNQQQNQQNQQQNQQDQQQDQQNQQKQQNQKNQINEQTSDQILDAAERKENARRAQMKTKNQESSEKSGRSTKNW